MSLNGIYAVQTLGTGSQTLTTPLNETLSGSFGVGVTLDVLVTGPQAGNLTVTNNSELTLAGTLSQTTYFSHVLNYFHPLVAMALPGTDTLMNRGTILNDAVNLGVSGSSGTVASTYQVGPSYGILAQGGSIGNAASALIAGGGAGIALRSLVSAETVSNAGTIAGLYTPSLTVDGAVFGGMFGDGIFSTVGLFGHQPTLGISIDNTGTIIGGAAIYQDSGPVTLTNLAGGLIYGTQSSAGAAYGVDASESAADIFNAGRILASGVNYARAGVGQPGQYSHEDGLRLLAGMVTNAAGGTISGSHDGVRQAADLNIDKLTILNQGLIQATQSGTAASIYGANAPTGVNFYYGMLVNSGSILVDSNAVGVRISNAGVPPQTIINTGLIDGGVAGIYAFGGLDFQNSGTIAGGIYGHSDAAIVNESVITGGIDMRRNLSMVNTGTITGGIYTKGSATIADTGLIAGGITFGAYTINGGGIVSGNRLLELAPGAVITGTVAVTTLAAAGYLTALELGMGSTAGSLDLAGSFYGFNEFSFDPGASWVLGGTGEQLATGQSVSGFAAGDTLILDGFSASSYQFNYGVLTLSNAEHTARLDISGNFAGLTITNVAQGAEIETGVCYLRGTPILTPDGERAIQDLRIGDTVVTRLGGVRRIKWIGEQRFAGRFIGNNDEMLPVCIKAGAIEHGRPSRDLFVSPGHSLLLGEILALAKSLINGITIVQGPVVDEVHYLNIELETHDCVLAAGIWAECYAECVFTRTKFHNAVDFFRRHPGHIAPPEPVLCAARPLEGPMLAEALAPVVARASALTKPGPLRGYVDILTSEGRIEGWAQDTANPELPVWLDVLHNGIVMAQLLACDSRADLRGAGIGSGRHAFRANLPPFKGAVAVRGTSGGGLLTRSAIRSVA